MYFPSGMTPQIVSNNLGSSAVMPPIPTVRFSTLGNPIVDKFAAMPVWAKIAMGVGVLAVGGFAYSRRSKTGLSGSKSSSSKGSRGNRSDVRSPTRTEVRSPTSTSTEVRSPTSTSTEVRSPTSTSTDAYTSGNVTVTGGAGDGATHVTILGKSKKEKSRADAQAHKKRSAGSATRMDRMIKATMAPRTPAPMPAIMKSTGASRPRKSR